MTTYVLLVCSVEYQHHFFGHNEPEPPEERPLLP